MGKRCSSGYNGLLIFDISNKSAPYFIGHYDTEGFTEDVMLQNNLAYLADGDSGLVIVDVTNPSTPVLIGSWSDSEYYAGTVFVKDTFAYLGCIFQGPSKIINVAQPSTPYWDSDFPPNGTADDYIWDAFIVDTLVYLAGDWYFSDTAWYQFMIASLSNPINPSLISGLNLPQPASGIKIQGNYAVVNDQYAGVRIIDISNSEAGLYGYSSAIYNYILITPELYKGYSIYNISNPAYPIKTFHLPNINRRYIFRTFLDRHGCCT